MLEECAGQPSEPFRRSEILGWFRRHHPEVNEATLAAHIQAATVKAANRARNNPHLAARLIYTGQAGATRWPSGRKSASTLWTRITGMDLGGAAEFSTFRRTLAAILGPVLAMASEDDPKLATWMHARLRVITVPVPDADDLGHIETSVLRPPGPAAESPGPRAQPRPCRTQQPAPPADQPVNTLNPAPA